jgi:hypothetical protein
MHLVMRLLRILRATIAILSLLLCLAIAVIWVRSYFTADYFSQYTTVDVQNRNYRPLMNVRIGKGGIGYCRTFWSAPPGFLDGIQNQPLIHINQPPHYPDFRFRPNDPTFLGFKFERIASSVPNGATVKVFAFILPLWSLLLLFLLLALPEFLYRYRLYKRRRNPHLCPGCGYDLRASPDTCPECGLHKPLPLEPTNAPAAR